MSGIVLGATEEVLAVGRFHFEGNIVPHTWYQHFRTVTDRPHLLAILILSDIVYWYRPTVERDEATGQIVSIRRKFKADLLQRSYEQLSAFFGVKKEAAREAIVFLEEKGVIKRVFRTIDTEFGKLHNVLFLQIFPDALAKTLKPLPSGNPPDNPLDGKKNTLNEDANDGNEGGQNGDMGLKKEIPMGLKKEIPMGENEGGGMGKKHPHPNPKNTHTNTEITTETATETKITFSSKTCAKREKPFSAELSATEMTIPPLQPLPQPLPIPASITESFTVATQERPIITQNAHKSPTTHDDTLNLRNIPTNPQKPHSEPLYPVHLQMKNETKSEKAPSVAFDNPPTANGECLLLHNLHSETAQNAPKKAKKQTKTVTNPALLPLIISSKELQARKFDEQPQASPVSSVANDHFERVKADLIANGHQSVFRYGNTAISKDQLSEWLKTDAEDIVSYWNDYISPLNTLQKQSLIDALIGKGAVIYKHRAKMIKNGHQHYDDYNITIRDLNESVLFYAKTISQQRKNNIIATLKNANVPTHTLSHDTNLSQFLAILSANNLTEPPYQHTIANPAVFFVSKRYEKYIPTDQQRNETIHYSIDLT